MNCKNRSHQRTPPESARQLAQEKEKQQHGHGMQKNIHEVMTCRGQAKHLDIQHVRDRGQRMPIAGVLVTKRPHDSAQRHAASDLLVLQHVNVVVVIHEVMTERLSENDPGETEQDDANQDGAHRLLLER